jgi:hypothetical protein
LRGFGSGGTVRVARVSRIFSCLSADVCRAISPLVFSWIVAFPPCVLVDSRFSGLFAGMHTLDFISFV